MTVPEVESLRSAREKKKSGRINGLTLSKLGKEDRRRLRDETALSGDTDAGPDVVSTDDSLSDTSTSKDGDGTGGGRLELVLEDDETEELKTRLGVLSAKDEQEGSAQPSTRRKGE